MLNYIRYGVLNKMGNYCKVDAITRINKLTLEGIDEFKITRNEEPFPKCDGEHDCGYPATLRVSYMIQIKYPQHSSESGEEKT